ncbi:hypothetical protein ACJ6WD_41035 [Streptomyces sp. VTCC 41912]|uniref:hypothetical protein n=1 Tax=Streptomyces sp. VTCC 41912 TaxID=3383243 RepID=UPI003896DF38
MFVNLDQLFAAEAAELALTGGCPACDLEADEMCRICGLCNCDRHDTCHLINEQECLTTMRDVNNTADVDQNTGTIIQIGTVNGGAIHTGSGDVVGTVNVYQATDKTEENDK